MRSGGWQRGRRPCWLHCRSRSGPARSFTPTRPAGGGWPQRGPLNLQHPAAAALSPGQPGQNDGTGRPGQCVHQGAGERLLRCLHRRRPGSPVLLGVPATRHPYAYRAASSGRGWAAVVFATEGRGEREPGQPASGVDPLARATHRAHPALRPHDPLPGKSVRVRDRADGTGDQRCC